MAAAQRMQTWLLAAIGSLLVLGAADSPVNLAWLAVLAIAAAVAWSLLRPSAGVPYGIGRRVPVPTDLLGPLRSNDPDAPGRPRPRAPGV